MSLVSSGESSSNLNDPACFEGSSQNLRLRVDIRIAANAVEKLNRSCPRNSQCKPDALSLGRVTPMCDAARMSMPGRLPLLGLVSGALHHQLSDLPPPPGVVF